MNRLRFITNIKKPVYQFTRFKHELNNENKPCDNPKINNNKNVWNNKGDDHSNWFIVVIIMFLITASLSPK